MADAPRRESVPGLPTTPYEPAPETPLLDTTTEPVPKRDDIPAFAGRFRIDGEIARGGIGIVLRAFDPQMQRPVAVKVLQPGFRGNPGAEARFHAEARLTGQLQHPGIPPAFEVGQLADGSPFFALKLIEGRTLQALLAGRPASPEDLALFEQVCRAVAFAHGMGVLHRDLKPGNVMVGAFGEVQVMDWGLAKVLGQTEEESAAPAAAQKLPEQGSTQPGTVLGTPAYMAPEQARGEIDRIDRRCDVFGLGGILCALLTGEPPFVGPQASHLARQGDVGAAFARLEASGANPVLVGLAKACLAPEPADRPADARVVAERVAAYRAAVEEERRRVERDRAAAEVRGAEAKRRRRWQLALAVSVALLVLAGLCAVAWQWHQQKARGIERAQHDEAVLDALGEVIRAGDQAAGLIDDLRGWKQEARIVQESWKRVDRLMDGREVSAKVRERVEEERQAWHTLEEERARREELDNIWQRLQERPTDEQARAQAAREYAAVYRACGIDLATLSPAEAARRIEAHRLRLGLGGFLDLWQAVARGADEAGRLAALITLREKLEPDLARQLRRSCATRSEDPEHQAAQEKLAEQCVKLPELKTFVLNQARVLFLSQEAEVVLVLKPLHDEYPEDYWINFDQGAVMLDYLRDMEGTPSKLDQPGDVLPGDENKEELADEVKRFQKLLDITPDRATVQYLLGLAHRLAQQEEPALAHLRQAGALDPSHAATQAALGDYLLMLGHPRDAIPALQRGCQLSPKSDPQRPKLEETLARANREIQLESKLLLLLEGRAKPAGPVEQLALAELAHRPAFQRYRTAVTLYADAFAARPALAADCKAGHRMRAIRCALRAADDRGNEEKTTAAERLRLWRLTRGWLRDEYAARQRLWQGDPKARQNLAHHVTTWKQHADMRSVVVMDASSRLPTAEQEAWRKLWQDLGLPGSTPPSDRADCR
jgi:hypothetical protein